MHEKSISYEHVISSLIDACGLIDDRKEDISIKRSFTTKQTIFSDVLFRRLLSYLSGDDEKLSVTLNNLFEILEEVMKDMCSSPQLLNINKETFDNQFKTDLLVPFIALLLFNMRFDFKETSPIYYFIDFLSKNSLNTTTPIDALSREYIKAKLKLLNIPDAIGDDFRNLIGKISLNSTLKIKTIDSKINELRTECEFISKTDNSKQITELSLVIHGIRFVLFFKDYIGDLLCCYNYARNFTKHKENAYWGELVKTAKDIVIRKNKKYKTFQEKLDEIIRKVKVFAANYYSNQEAKHNSPPDEILKYLTRSSFQRDFSLTVLDGNKHLKNSIHYNLLDVFVNIYDGEFDFAVKKINWILNELDKYPRCRLSATLSKLYIALSIKTNGLRIKNNSLDPYIYKIISTDCSRTKATYFQCVTFLNKSSLFSNNPEFYTITDSLCEWHDFIREKLKINPLQSSMYNIEFADKIESSLNKIYVSLDCRDSDLSIIDDNELKKLIKSTLTTNELLENVITFIPNFTLYFALREIGLICSGLSPRMALNSVSILKFLSEPIRSKKKLLKAIDLSEFLKDEENEKSLQEVI